MSFFVIPMSLKHYIFSLLAFTLLLFAFAQFVLFEVIEQRVADEITAKSNAISDVALRVVNQQQRIQRVPTEGVRIVLTKTPNKRVDLGDGLYFVTGDQTLTANITPLYDGESLSSNDISVDRVGSGFQFFSTDQMSGEVSQHVVQFDQSDSALQQYFQTMWTVTAGLLIIVLLFAYWLAKHLSRPLSDLSKGFTALEQGQLGTQINESGVREVRAMLSRFNHTSRQLHKLQSMQQKLREQQQMAELGEVARGLAHSLRNPLNTIGLAVEQLCERNNDDAQRSTLSASIRAKIQQMDNSIQSLMQLSKGDVDRSHKVILAHIVDDLTLQFATASKVRMQLEDRHHAWIRGAEAELRTMLQVLLSNAVEASHDKSVVTVTLSRERQQITIMVMDEGCGIPTPLQDKLCQPHVTGKAEGAGMGLFIVKRLAELYYQGGIEVVNNSDKGVTATLTLHDVQDAEPHD
ncbi:sensor histidine kinase [Aestuariibacter salexigens]|uniref:sensor histidine kinase n=1 Tax=Aestuariibacter salexigens TaxID=226010 RepID=UPI00041CA290|nr:HAMP domain-containing sensor histidine kinase [Aestuariibacter salexigens]